MRPDADPLRQIADAVLYEGYVLWPYRRSATKNQRRWTFGGVYPRAHSAAHPDDRWTMQTQCLVEGPAPRVDVVVRFLHVVERRLMRAGRAVDELTVDGMRHLAWDEATEREVTAPGPIAIPAGEREEDLGGGGTLVRSWRSLEGEVEVSAEPLAEHLQRVTVRIANTSPFAGSDREQALRQTFCSTHTILRADGGAFVSLTDPPGELRDAAERCANEGTWPVLVGAPGGRDTLLSSPIILGDYPAIAPESPGDLFDGGEIDQLLVLNILSLTDEEKEEMRAADPRTREILERTEALSEEQLMSLHGAIREFGMARPR
jgi:hypothetical protein